MYRIETHKLGKKVTYDDRSRVPYDQILWTEFYRVRLDWVDGETMTRFFTNEDEARRFMWNMRKGKHCIGVVTQRRILSDGSRDWAVVDSTGQYFTLDANGY